ncbi:hypothetical protein HPB50_015748 [Hyalomma asiaticum]|uniref:Uncharacterized protein n=1 Tax=Hyalomma asiaticum TaxID=266040 RepID=A0ACB7SD32_HYAAI|nr:hypothetical protein HPB50_015748 [Hyalomma asiaticum]
MTRSGEGEREQRRVGKQSRFVAFSEALPPGGSSSLRYAHGTTPPRCGVPRSCRHSSPRRTQDMQQVSTRSASRLLLVAAAILLVQVLGEEVTTKAVVAESGDTKPDVLVGRPPCEKGTDETGDTSKRPRTGGRPLRPFNLGINIPYFFNMRLLTGPTGTGLGLNVPAILNFQLDAAHRRRPGFLLSLFGNRGILFNRRKRPGNPLFTSPLRPPFTQPPEEDNAIDIKRKPAEKAA